MAYDKDRYYHGLMYHMETLQIEMTLADLQRLTIGRSAARVFLSDPYTPLDIQTAYTRERERLEDLCRQAKKITRELYSASIVSSNGLRSAL